MNFEEERPPAPLAELVALERELGERGWTLPPSYKAFLARQDGGRPTAATSVFRYVEHGVESRGLVGTFLGVRPSPGGIDLLSQVRSVGRYLPKGVLPVAADPGGNYVCIDARDGHDGPVLFWDHEQIPDEPDDSNLHVVAPTFAAFLDSLEELQPPAAPERRSGLRRLFGR